MAKKFAQVLAALAIASTLLAGCGAVGNGITASIKPAEATSTVKAKDYYSVTQAHRLATNGLDRYNVLRDRWMRAHSDAEKDRIEDQMLVVLSGAIGDVRNSVSGDSGASGYDSRKVFDIADRAISRYENLRYEWSNSHNLQRQREISNEMQSVVVNALQRVLAVRPY